MATEVAEPPQPQVTEPVLPNPVLPSDLELSKANFRQNMEAETSRPSAPETPADPKPEVSPPPTIPEVEEKPKSDESVEKPIETPAAKSKLPEELITGKKPEVTVDEAIQKIRDAELPKNAKPDQIQRFGELKKYAETIVQEKLARINELETKTSEGASRHEIEAAQERVKAAETKAQELESTIERIAFTESPRFKQFIADESATLASAKAYFEGTEINPDIVEYAARTTGAQRVKILREAGADPELIASVQPYLVQYDNIQRYKAGALENWKAESAQMAEQQKAHQAAQLEQRRAEEDNVWTGSVSKFEQELVPLRKFEKNDAWNSRSDEIKSKAKAIYNGDGIGLDVVADTILKGVAYDALDEVRVALTEELNKLIVENGKLKAAKPNGGSVQGAGTPASEENLPPMEAAKRRFNIEKAKAEAGA